VLTLAALEVFIVQASKQAIHGTPLDIASDARKPQAMQATLIQQTIRARMII
jgi:hypothetical protein